MNRTILTTETCPNLTTGVLNGYAVDGEFFEAPEHDPVFEEAQAEAVQRARKEAEDAGESDDAIEAAGEAAAEDLSDAWDGSYYNLFGSWKKTSEGYEPDHDGNEKWAAVYRRDTNVIQVVWSIHYMECNQCSPCYPLQGDLDTEGSHYTCYALPPDVMDETWLKENQHRYLDASDREWVG